MPSVADCLRQHGPAYLQTFGEAVPLGHHKVLSAITRCRTGELGGVLYECQSCGREHWVGRSCGNRHCPTCGIDKTAAWLEKQTAKLLPIEHFLITFTIPWELRRVFRAHQKVCYDALFQCGSENRHRRSPLVGVAVSGLEILAGQRICTATAADRAQARSLCRVWGRNEDR